MYCLKYNLCNFIESFFDILTGYVIVVPWLFILLPISLSMSLGYFCKDFRFAGRFWVLFTPTDSPSWYETQVYNEFNQRPYQRVITGAKSDGGLSYLYTDVYVSLPDESPILYPNYTTTIMETITAIETLEYSYKGRTNNTLEQFCKIPGIDCPDSNLLVRLFIELFFDDHWRHNERVSFTYPLAELVNVRVQLSENFLGFIPTETTLIDSIVPSTVIKQFRVVKLRFLCGVPTSQFGTTEPEVRAFAKQVQAFVHELSNRNDSNLKFTFNAWYLMSEAIHQNGQVAKPKLRLAILTLIAFAIVSCFSIDCATGKVWEGVAGVVSSLMAVVSTVGLMVWSKNITSGIVVLMPFLVLSIGIDDTFVLLGAWGQTSRTASPDVRLKTTMKNAGVSVTITSLTDVISFAFGTLSSTPAVSSFCLYVSIGVLFDFIYQITFMPAIIYYGGIRESSGMSYCFCCTTATCSSENNETERTGDFKPKRTPVDSLNSKRLNLWNKFVAVYVDVISRSVTFIFVSVITVASWITCIYGMLNLQVGMDIRDLLIDNSPMLDVANFMQNYAWDEGIPLSIIVNNPPDLNDDTSRWVMLKMIGEFELIPFSIGRNGTDAWLRKCDLFYRNGVYRSFWHAYDGWKGMAGNDFYNRHIKLGDVSDGDPHLISFKFVVTVNKQREWSHRLAVADYSRGLAKQYHEYNVTIFQSFNLYIDQVNGLPRNVALTVGGALAVMVVILVLCIPNILTIYAIISMSAINIGVVGMLSLTGHNLDPIALGAIITCIGLSVDFTSHVTHHFSRNYNLWNATMQGLTHTELVTKSVTETLESLMWPMLQSGLSTFLGILVFQFTPSNMMRVIFLEVSTVIWLGLWYGLVVLPSVFLNINFQLTCHPIFGES